MKGNTHLYTGALFSMNIAMINSCVGTVEPEKMLVFAGACMAGSLLPDIDNKKSKLGKICFFLRPIQKTFDHRSCITHTPIFPIALTTILYFALDFILKKEILFGFCIGYLIHLLCDVFTPKGIRLFYPFSNKYTSKKIPLPETVTGTMISYACAFILIAGLHL